MMAPPSEFTQSPTKPFDIAVVGGGIGGLLLALALLKHRIPVTLYESAHKFGEIGAGVSVGPNAARALQLISPHTYQAFENCCTRNQSEKQRGSWFDFRYGQDAGDQRVDQQIVQLECEGGQAGVYRARFLDELVNLLPDGVAKFGKRAMTFEDQGDKGVLIKFKDGSEARHDAVIGCDGIKSQTRLALYVRPPYILYARSFLYHMINFAALARSRNRSWKG